MLEKKQKSVIKHDFRVGREIVDWAVQSPCWINDILTKTWMTRKNQPRENVSEAHSRKGKQQV